MHISPFLTSCALAMTMLLTASALYAQTDTLTDTLDALRDADPNIVRNALTQARDIANPRLAPALLDHMQNHHDPEIRRAALDAYTRLIPASAFADALDATLTPQAPDATQARLLRALPTQTALSSPNMANRYADLATLSPWTTSVAAAYQRTPDLLFKAILHKLARHTDARDNLWRVLALLAPHLENTTLTQDELQILESVNPDELQVCAAIQASIATPRAARWILAHLDTLTPAATLDVLKHLHGEAEPMIIAAILKTPQAMQKIQATPALYGEFVRHLAVLDSTETQALARDILTSGDEQTLQNAMPAMVNLHDAPSHARLLSLLGHPNPRIATQALHIVGNTPELWTSLLDIVERNPKDDPYGKTYLARWALVLIATQHPDALSDAHKTRAVALALRALDTPSSLHAEPALWTLLILKHEVDLPSPDVFGDLRPDMQCAFLRALHPDDPHAIPILRDAITSPDDAVAALAFDVLTQTPEQTVSMLRASPEMQKTIEDAITSGHAMRSTHAAYLAGTLQHPAFKDALIRALHTSDPFITYNALWALQKLRALPDDHILRTLYFRAPDGVLRDRLAFLTGIQNDHHAISSDTLLRHRQILQWSVEDRPLAGEDIVLLQDDNALSIQRTNLFGFLFPAPTLLDALIVSP